MKDNSIENKTNVLASNLSDQQGSGYIKASPFAFKILSQKLYRDVFKPYFREYGSNGTDANRSMGLEHKPLLVKLPNEADPEMYIQDDGPGLSFEDIKAHMLGYFSSNKSHNNDDVGMFGLGSKVGFAYSSFFTLTSAHNGEEFSCTCFKDNEGYPKVALNQESIRPVSANWPHGLRVSMAVKQDDIRRFISAAHQVLRWYEVTPTILGGEPIEKLKFWVKHENIELFPQANSLNGYGLIKPWLVMGSVAYPVAFEEIYSDLEAHPLLMRFVQETMINLPMAIHVNIGDVDVSVSREELEYTPATRSVLLKAAQTTAQFYCAALIKFLEQESEKGWTGRLAMRRQARANLEGEALFYAQDAINFQRVELAALILGKTTEEQAELRLKSSDLVSSVVPMPSIIAKKPFEDYNHCLLAGQSKEEAKSYISRNWGWLEREIENLEKMYAIFSYGKNAIRPFKVYKAERIENRTKHKIKPPTFKVSEVDTQKSHVYVHDLTAIYYADCSDAKQRVKEEFTRFCTESWDGVESTPTMYLIEAASSSAKKYAELLSSLTKGIPVLAASLLETPKKSKPKRTKASNPSLGPNIDDIADEVLSYRQAFRYSNGSLGFESFSRAPQKRLGDLLKTTPIGQWSVLITNKGKLDEEYIKTNYDMDGIPEFLRYLTDTGLTLTDARFCNVLEMNKSTRNRLQKLGFPLPLLTELVKTKLQDRAEVMNLLGNPYPSQIVLYSDLGSPYGHQSDLASAVAKILFDLRVRNEALYADFITEQQSNPWIKLSVEIIENYDSNYSAEKLRVQLRRIRMVAEALKADLTPWKELVDEKALRMEMSKKVEELNKAGHAKYLNLDSIRYLNLSVEAERKSLVKLLNLAISA